MGKRGGRQGQLLQWNGRLKGRLEFFTDPRNSKGTHLRGNLYSIKHGDKHEMHNAVKRLFH